MKKNMLLQGNIKKELISLAIPLFIGNILQQLYNTIDSIIICRYLGTTPFAAVGLSGTIMNLFIFILNGFCVGVSILFSQLYGMGNEKKFRQEFALSNSVGLAITIFVSAISLLFLNPLLTLLQTPEKIFVQANTYLSVILAGLFSTYLYNLFSNVLRSVGDTTASLLFLFISLLLNTVLDILFIAVFKMDISGAAYATIISQLCSALCCLFYIRCKYPQLLWHFKDMSLDKFLLKKTLSYGGISALQQSSLYIGKLLVQGAVNTLGTSAITSYTATMRVEGVVNAFSDSGSQSISVLVAQNHGADNKKRIKASFHYGLILLIILGIFLACIMNLTAPFCITFLVGSSDNLIIKPGIEYLKVISIFYVFCYIGNAFVGYFRGIGKINIPFIATSIHITLRVILSYLLIDTFNLSAVALASGIGWICVVFIHWFNYYRQNAN